MWTKPKPCQVEREVKGGGGGGEFEIMMLPQDNGGSGQLRKTCVGPYKCTVKQNEVKIDHCLINFGIYFL